MVTGEGLRQICLSLPEVEEKPHFDRTSFRIGVPRGKIFATMTKDGSSANLVLSRDEQHLLCAAEPDMFAPVPNKWGEKGSTMIALERADGITLRSACQMAWRRAAPPKLWALIDN